MARIALQQRLRHRILVGGEVVQERIPQRRLLESALDSLSTHTAFGISLKRRPPLLAQNELDFPELMRLKPAAGLEPVAKCQKIERRDCLEHIDLRYQRLQNCQNALERGGGQRRVETITPLNFLAF